MKSKWRLFIVSAAIISVGSLGGLFLFGKNKNNDAKVISAGDVNSGVVAGATTIGTGDYLTELAQYLTDQGMVLYGSYSCQQCQEQKALFGESAARLDYVECDSAGPNANRDECVANEIDSYPTWVFQGKKYSGVLSLAEIAKIVNFSQN